jgi:hypothetical protein
MGGLEGEARSVAKGILALHLGDLRLLSRVLGVLLLGGSSARVPHHLNSVLLLIRAMVLGAPAEEDTGSWGPRAQKTCLKLRIYIYTGLDCRGPLTIYI